MKGLLLSGIVLFVVIIAIIASELRFLQLAYMTWVAYTIGSALAGILCFVGALGISEDEETTPTRESMAVMLSLAGIGFLIATVVMLFILYLAVPSYMPYGLY